MGKTNPEVLLSRQTLPTQPQGVMGRWKCAQSEFLIIQLTSESFLKIIFLIGTKF
jgi:hypothetical protein